MVGFVCFGEINTPFAKLQEKHDEAYAKLAELVPNVVDAGLAIDDEGYKTADAAYEKLAGKDLSCLVVCIAGWVPTHAVIRVTDHFRHVPMVLWGLCGWIESDGRLVTTADQAGTSALRKTMKDLGYTFKYVYDIIGKPSRSADVLTYCKAAAAYKAMRSAKIGQMGFRDMHLYGTMFDGCSLKKTVGAEIECFEMLEVVQRAEKVTDAAVDEVINTTVKGWKFLKEADMSIVRRGVTYYLALKDIIDERKYKAISLKDVDGM